MRVLLVPLSITAAGTAAHSSTTVDTAGAHVVVVETEIADPPLALTSVFTGAIGDRAAVTHMQRAPGTASGFTQGGILAAEHASETHISRCVLEHVAELQGALSALVEATVTVDISSTALAAAARAWDQQR